MCCIPDAGDDVGVECSGGGSEGSGVFGGNSCDGCTVLSPEN